MWRPGQSGNPTGKGGEYHRCKALCREASADAATEIIRLFKESDDDRVRYMAGTWIYEQAWGKSPPAFEPPEENETHMLEALARLSPERRARLREALLTQQKIIADAMAEGRSDWPRGNGDGG